MFGSAIKPPATDKPSNPSSNPLLKPKIDVAKASMGESASKPSNLFSGGLLKPKVNDDAKPKDDVSKGLSFGNLSIGKKPDEKDKLAKTTTAEFGSKPNQATTPLFGDKKLAAGDTKPASATGTSDSKPLFGA